MRGKRWIVNFLVLRVRCRHLSHTWWGGDGQGGAGGQIGVRGGVTGGVHPLTGAFSESSSSSLVKRLKQSWSDTFPPAKLFWRAMGSGGNLGGV